MENESFEAHRESRRDLLRKAGVGAAIVWAAPVVSSVVTPAAAQTGGGTGGECTETFLIKYDYETCTGGDFVYRGSADPSCSATPTPTKNPGGQGSGDCAISTSTDSDDDDGCTVSVTLPADATNIVGYVKQGPDCLGGIGPLYPKTSPSNQGANVSVNGNVVTFTKVVGFSHLDVSFCSNACVDQLASSGGGDDDDDDDDDD